MILLGDHYQLPPTVLNSKAIEAGFQVPLFERLVNEWEVKPLILKSQYRMHPMSMSNHSHYYQKLFIPVITYHHYHCYHHHCYYLYQVFNVVSQ